MTVRKEPDFSYMNENGKRVAGAAATLNYIYSVCGGIREYNDRVGKAYIENFIKAHSQSIQDSISRTAKKSRFKKVG